MNEAPKAKALEYSHSRAVRDLVDWLGSDEAATVDLLSRDLATPIKPLVEVYPKTIRAMSDMVVVR